MLHICVYFLCVLFCVQPLSDLLDGAKLDLTLLAVLASGNDYLPALRGLKLDGERLAL